MPKQPGPPLEFLRLGGEDPIPSEFIAAMERREVRQAVPNDWLPNDLSDLVVESRVETDRTNERVRLTIEKKSGNITLLGYNQNDQGAPVQVTRIFRPTGPLVSTPGANAQIAVRDLGNGWSIEEVLIEGTWDEEGEFVPSLFTSARYRVTVDEVIPSVFFAAAPLKTESVIEAGTASMPTLVALSAAYELERQEEQISPTRKRVTRVFREISFPLSLTDSVLTEFGLAARERVLSYDTPEPESDYLTLSSEVNYLGNDVWYKETISVASYPVLVEEKSDPDYPGTRIRVTRQIIAAVADPTAVYDDTQFTLTEYEPLDSRRSIRFVSKVMSLPTTRVSYGFGVHSFPDEWISGGIDERFIVEVQDTSTGDPIAVARYAVFLYYDIREGYSGMVKLRITEEWHRNEVVEGDLPAVVEWAPQAHRIFIHGTEASPVFLGGREETIPACLHPALDFSSDPGAVPPSIAATSPTALPHSSWVVKHAESSHWLFGVWKVTLVEMYVP